MDDLQGYDGEERAFIATQGPLAHTVGALFLRKLKPRCHCSDSQLGGGLLADGVAREEPCHRHDDQAPREEPGLLASPF